MSGNVWEHCLDHYQNHYGGLAYDNPRGPDIGLSFVARGGAYRDDARGQRVSDRNWFDPSTVVPHLGLRLALVADSISF